MGVPQQVVNGPAGVTCATGKGFVVTTTAGDKPEQGLIVTNTWYEPPKVSV